MKTIVFLLLLTGTAAAQCTGTQCQQPQVIPLAGPVYSGWSAMPVAVEAKPVQMQQTGTIWVQQRYGLFGWRVRWVQRPAFAPVINRTEAGR